MTTPGESLRTSSGALAGLASLGAGGGGEAGTSLAGVVGEGVAAGEGLAVVGLESGAGWAVVEGPGGAVCAWTNSRGANAKANPVSRKRVIKLDLFLRLPSWLTTTLKLRFTAPPTSPSSGTAARIGMSRILSLAAPKTS